MLTTIHELGLEDALRAVKDGAVFIDLRRASDYLDVHIPGSVCVHYEAGPGMPTRARDCIPLDVPMILMDEGHGDIRHAASSLRGKGFPVLGVVREALARWGEKNGHPASTESVQGAGSDDLVLDVRDPRAPRAERAEVIPVERPWEEAASLDRNRRIVVLAGAGVRAALAVGILERHGLAPALWRSGAGD